MTTKKEFTAALVEVEAYIQQHRDGLTTAYECRSAIIDKLHEIDVAELIKDHDRNLAE
jgi:hypothetical protein